jgi:hypothetical protein
MYTSLHSTDQSMPFISSLSLLISNSLRHSLHAVVDRGCGRDADQIAMKTSSLAAQNVGPRNQLDPIRQL